MAEPINKGSEGMFECPKCHAKRHIRRGESTRCQADGCDGIMIRTATSGTDSKKKLFVAIGAIALAAIGVGTYLTCGTSPVKPPIHCDTCDTPTHKPDPTKYDESFPYYISYGIYKGETKDGYAEGQGEFIFTQEHLVNEKDIMYNRVAQKGWRVVGTFYHGYFINGRLYKDDGEFEVLNIGKTTDAETTYGEKLKER